MVPNSALRSVLKPHQEHSRLFQQNRYVYPVLSRRSRGISVGINLNPDKVCNFDCIYCQVNRRTEAETRFVETPNLLDELEHTLDLVVSGALYDDPRFAMVPAELRRLNDIAFSGDGEPTTFSNIETIVAQVAEVKRRRELADVKLVMITNASMFHRPVVQEALRILDANQGEIWAKLDAGTESYFQLVDRTTIPFRRILDNLHAAARVRPLVIQSLFMRVQGAGPTNGEIEAFCARLSELCADGGRINRVQAYTIARPPAESYVGSLSPSELDAIANAVKERVGVPVETYYGAAD
jgi:wyosine [tRNA(Phe)-imidazoG37] synthetase (radical SAM superfamily)